MPHIYINNASKVKAFCDAANTITGEVSLVSGSRVVNAKSILEIFLLDLHNPIELYVQNDNVPDCLQPFITLKEENTYAVDSFNG